MTELEALKTERDVIKQLYQTATAEKQALDQTVTDVVKANINLKAGCILLERQIETLKQEVTQLKDQLSKASEPQLAEAA